MSTVSQTLEKLAPTCEITFSRDILRQFELYANMLLEYNEKFNLTAITEPNEIAVKHFFDSLLPLKAIDFNAGDSIIDIGTGAGFPGIPIKMMIPGLKLTLLDSLNKRVTFLSELSQSLGQNNEVIHARAERHAHLQGYRESFDYSTARAVAALPALCEYCLPFVRIGGCFIALKGPGAHHEAVNAEKAISLLGGQIEFIKAFSLPPNIERNVVIIKKISRTPTKYPRISVKISKKPL